MSEFLQTNWFWIVLIGLFIWMHSSGMGCGGHDHGGDDEKKREKGAGHRH
jgi:hypothetical protein